VLRDVSLRLAPGRITAFIGPNGAGKSTLLRLMGGIRTPVSGSVRLESAEVSAMPPRARAGRIGYLGQRPEVAFAYTVREFVALGLYAAGRAGARGAVELCLETVDLSARAEEVFGVLSAGQQQRAALARVLAQLGDGGDGAVLLADEPISAMDPRHVLGTLDLFRRLAGRGAAIALVLHDLTLASRFCDCAAVLGGDGRLVAMGPVAEVLIPQVLDPVFDVRFRVLSDGADPAGRVVVPATVRAVH
jgi:iron complex transport system ATP-binding protein